MSILMKSSQEVAQDLAKRAQARRLSLNLSQQTLSNRSGVSYGTLKKFERTGQISLGSLLKIALILGELENFDQRFRIHEEELPPSLDELLKEHSRKRGRK